MDGRRLNRPRMTIRSTPMMNTGEIKFCHQPYPKATTPKAEKKIELWNVLPKKKGFVAARLRGLWTIDSSAEGHTKLVDNKLKPQE